MSNLKERRKAANKAIKTMSPKFIEENIENNPHRPEWMSRCFRNNRYTVMIDDNHNSSHGKCIRVMVQNHFDTPILGHWKELQKIKNEIFGPETVAVEYFPAESKLVDDHNIYWLFIYPAGVLPLPTY